MQPYLSAWLLTALSLILSHAAQAGSASTEQHFTSDLLRQLPADEILQLSAEQQQFLLLQRQPMTSYTKGTAILLPDGHEHPASPKHINRLRQQLNDLGWHTLALMPPQLPASLAQAETLQTYQQQLQQRLSAAQQQAKSNPGVTIVIAQGSSAAIVNQLYASASLAEPAAFIMLGAYLPDDTLNRDMAKALATHQVPTLEISHDLDNRFVAANLLLRRQLANKHLKAVYRQRQLTGSGYHTDVQHWVQKEIYGWLNSVGL